MQEIQDTPRFYLGMESNLERRCAVRYVSTVCTICTHVSVCMGRSPGTNCGREERTHLGTEGAFQPPVYICMYVEAQPHGKLVSMGLLCRYCM
jgi:hypothetical protein